MTAERGPRFLRSVFQNTTAALADLFFFKLGTTLMFLVLVRLLPPEDIGAIGVAAGYLVLLGFLDVKPVLVILRDWPKLTPDRTERDLHLTAFLAFWILQSAAVLLATAGLQVFVLSRLGIPGLPFLFWALAVEFVAVTFQDLVKTVLYADFQQMAATKIGLLLGFVRLGSLALLLLQPSLAVYGWILLGLACLTSLAWGAALAVLLGFRLVVRRRIPSLLRASLTDYGLWNHGQRVVSTTLLGVDTLILSLLGTPLRQIAAYTIALRFTSVFFFQISWQISHALQVVLARQAEEERRVQAINGFLKIGTMVSLVQLAVVALGGEVLLRWLFGAQGGPDAFRYALILGIGATLMNLGWPLIGVINALCSLRRAFLEVFLPALVTGLLVYFVAGLLGGAMGVAYGNIAVYGFLVCALALFLWRHRPFRLDPRFITPAEKGALRTLLRARS